MQSYACIERGEWLTLHRAKRKEKVRSDWHDAENDEKKGRSDWFDAEKDVQIYFFADSDCFHDTGDVPAGKGC